MVAAATNPFLNPDGALVASILDALSRPGASLPTVAAQHRISIAALALWLDSPQAREALLAIERGVHAHIRLAAALELPAAVTALSHIITDFTDARNALGLPSSPDSTSLAPSSSAPLSCEPLPPRHTAAPRPGESSIRVEPASSPSPASPSSPLPLSYHRHSTAGRKAIWLLYRLTRLTPIDGSAVRGSIPPAEPRPPSDTPAPHHLDADPSHRAHTRNTTEKPAPAPNPTRHTPQPPHNPPHASEETREHIRVHTRSHISGPSPQPATPTDASTQTITSRIRGDPPRTHKPERTNPG
ncbi:MAG: hypothetical protein KF838_13800 [Phycisphaeraceae bacterium]|nr:MAG: hypothetical protein KF838_13800 [Phycisphaeraceae bacterium]